MYLFRTVGALKLAGLLVVLVLGMAWPLAVYAAGPATDGPQLQSNPMTGAIDVQRGSVAAQVAFERAELALNAKLTDAGPEGRFSIATPFPFVATVTAANGNVDAQVCGVVGSQAASIGGGLGSGLRIEFRNADTDPAACAPPTSSVAALTMAPNIVVAQATPAAIDSGLGDSLAIGLRRLIVLAIISGLLFVFIPGLWTPVGVTAQTAPWSRLGLGLCLVIALPVIGILVFMLGLSLGVWWFGLLLLLAFVCVLAAGITLSGVIAGAWLSQRIRSPRVPPIAAVAIGLIALIVLGLLPSIGALVTVLATMYGAGALILLPRAVAAQPAAPVQPLETSAAADGAVVALPPQEPLPVAGESQTNGVPSAMEPAPSTSEPQTKGMPSQTEPEPEPKPEPTTGAA